MAGEAAGTKKQCDQLRAALRDQGCTPEQIAAEMGRQFGFRARQAWRHAHGWTQEEAAAAYNRQLDDGQAPMTGKRISDFEAWPHGGKKPLNALGILARIYSTGVLNLVDLDDRRVLSAKELINLDAHKKSSSSSPSVSESPDTTPENSTRNPTAAGEHSARPESNISITVHQTHHTPETTTPSKHRRWQRVSILLLAITAVISGAIVAGGKMMTGSQPTTPNHSASSPSITGSVSASASVALPVSPLSTVPTSSSVPPAPAVSSPRQRFTPLATPIRAVNVSPEQQMPLPPQEMLASPESVAPPTPPPTRLDGLPPPSKSPTTATTSTLTTDVSWKNMYYDKCLDEQELDIIHDPANLELWDCNGFSNQMWTEKTIVANPTSIAKNLVSAKTGRCVTYQPGDYSDRAKIWLTPCGKDGQGWIRTPSGTGYMFEAAEVRGMCMAATTGTVTDATGQYTGILLRRCDTSSPLKDWRLY